MSYFLLTKKKKKKQEAPSPLYLKDLYSSGKRITKEASYQEDRDKQLEKRPVVWL